MRTHAAQVWKHPLTLQGEAERDRSLLWQSGMQGHPKVFKHFEKSIQVVVLTMDWNIIKLRVKEK